MGLVDRRIGVGTPRSVGVRNRDAPESLAGNDPGLVLLGRPVRVDHRVALIRVAVRPAIDSDLFDVAGRTEPSPRERPSQLLSDLALEHLERRRQKLESTHLVLTSLRKARLAR